MSGKSPIDPEAEVARLKDGCTALPYKVENAVDMETGTIVMRMRPNPAVWNRSRVG